MSEQHTNVTYNAVSNFATLHGDVDSLLAKIKAIKKAEKDLNQQRAKTALSPGLSKAANPERAAKLQEAADNRRIKRLDAAQRILAAQEARQEKAKDQALNRRTRAALQAQRILEAQEARQERSRDAAQRRRSQRANQDLKNSIAAENRSERNKDAAQRRREKAADDAQAERLRKEKHAADLVRAAEKAQLAEDIRNEAIADEISRRKDLTAARDIERVKDEASRERIRQERIQSRSAEAEAKKNAEELGRKLAAARSGLSSVNREASDANRFTRRPVESRSVGEVKVDFNKDRDANYYEAVSRARQEEIRQVERATAAVRREMDARGGLYNVLRKIGPAAREAGVSTSTSFRGAERDIRRTNSFLDNFRRNLDQVGRWRPHLIPPFIALVPIIGAVLALMNPLVAGLGAVGAAAIGLASNLGSLAGAALGAIPALASLLSVGAALKMVFGGVGKALKAGTKSMDPPKTAKSQKPQLEELTQTEKIARAQEKYRRSIEDVADAQKNLTAAKQEYFDKLKQIEEQVKKNALAEARAAANVQLAQENYWNVMADSSSTKGQKMDAAVKWDEAKKDAQDTTKEIRALRKELSDMQKGGVAQDPGVQKAMRAVTDAIWAQRDAQIDLANAYKDTGSAAEFGANEMVKFEDEMDNLSPKAQEFVRILLSMKGAWDAVRMSVQDRFFGEILSDVSNLTKLFPTLERLLGNTAGALGRVASQGLKMVTSDKWIRDLNILAEQNVPLIENVGSGLLEILDALLDLSIAVGPFAEGMSKGFADGAKNFGTMVEEARKSGSLANWLETIRKRLEQWWRIVKNVGKTIFNYSAAASSFGQWMTDGVERMTENWKKASEEARKEGSPFQTWLEDTKPALEELRRLFATFFKWFGREASNTDNINQFTRIIKTITDDLGPALARIFDAMSKTGVGESLLDAIVTILETIATFLERGGAEGIKKFFDTVNDLFSTFADIIDRTDPEVIKGIAGALATISALRFFGLTKVLGSLLTLVTSGKIGQLTTMFKSMGTGGKEVPTPNTSTPGTVTGNNSKTPGGIVGGTNKTPGGSAAKNAAKGAAKAAGKGGGFVAGLGKVGKFAKGAGPIGLAASAVLGMITDIAPNIGKSFDGTYAKDPRQGSKDNMKYLAKWGMPGIGLGVDIISLLFPDTGKAINDWLDGITGDITDWFQKDLPKAISDLHVNIFKGLLGMGTWLGEQWQSVITWFQNLPYNIGVAAGEIWSNLKSFGVWLGEQWTNAVLWFQNLPTNIANTVSDIWSNLKSFGSWLGDQWVKAVDWFNNLPENIANTAKDIWSNLKSFGSWLGEQSVSILLWAITLPAKIGEWAKGIWDSLPGIGVWLGKQIEAVGKWVTNDLPKALTSPLQDFFNGFQAGSKKGSSLDTSGLARGGAGKMAPMTMNRGKRGSSGGSDAGLWATIFGDPVSWLNDQWTAIGSWFSGKTGSILTMITTISTGITIVWTSLWAGFTKTLTNAYNLVVLPITKNIGAAFTFMKTVVSNGMNAIKSVVFNVWNFGILPVLSVMIGFVKTKPAEAFKAAAGAIGRAWGAIREMAAAPVRFVVDVVIGGLVDAVNSIPGVKVKKPRLPKGFHDGGYTGNAPWREAVDVVHGGEHVIRAQSRQKIERSSPGLLDYMNTYGQLPEGYKNGGLVNPLPAGSYSVTQPYKGAAHNGIDLGAPMGTKVYAAGEGTVMLAGGVNMGGNEVYIQHKNGLGTRYSHLSRFASRVGDKVRPGNIIGYVGATGMATGPHLHYMVQNPGPGPQNYYNHVNPAGWMNGNAQELKEAWNPMEGISADLTSQVTKKFPKSGMWAAVASGILKQAADQATKHFTPKIGTDKDKGNTLFDRGGWWNGDEKPVSKLNQPEAILTTPQWESMYRLSTMMGSAFSGINGNMPTSTAYSGASLAGIRGNVSTSETKDNRIIIEKVEINNPVGETTNASIANQIRDLNYLRG